MGKLNKLREILYSISNVKMLSLLKKQNIFGYHHVVSNDELRHITNLYNYKNVQTFIDDIDFLLRHYTPIDPLDLGTGKKIKNGFLLTFDDGLAEIYQIVYPILKERGLSAIFFINPAFVGDNQIMNRHYQSLVIEYIRDNKINDVDLSKIASVINLPLLEKEELILSLIQISNIDYGKLLTISNILNYHINDHTSDTQIYVTKDQIKEMIADGFYFGGHTMSHPRLDTLPVKEQRKEIIDSIKWVKSNFDLNYSFFAFPYTDALTSKSLITDVLSTDVNLIVFGNTGMREDFDSRIIQRISLEQPEKSIDKVIVSENLLKFVLQFLRKNKLKRND